MSQNCRLLALAIILSAVAPAGCAKDGQKKVAERTEEVKESKKQELQGSVGDPGNKVISGRGKETSKSAPSPTLAEKHTGFVGIGIASVEGRIVIKTLTLGSPAQAKGLRLGDQLLGVGRTEVAMIDIADKTVEQVMKLLRGKVGETVWLRYQPKNAVDPVTVKIIRRERFDWSKALTFHKDNYETNLPREFVERFPGSPRKYAYFNNQSKLLAFPDQHAGERVAVVTELLFPKVGNKQLELHMFSDLDSPVGLVDRSKTPKFFEKLVNNDPTKNKWVIMHLRLALYSNAAKLYGEIEEIVFLDDQAPDSYKPLIFDQVEVGRKIPEGKP